MNNEHCKKCGVSYDSDYQSCWCSSSGSPAKDIFGGLGSMLCSSSFGVDMDNYGEYGITSEQYHAGIAKLWEALGVAGPQQDDVFTIAAREITRLKSKVRERPWIDRVVEEKRELDAKATKLSEFIGLSETFIRLPHDEQERMKEQCEIMWQYSEILGKRILAQA